MAETVRLKNSRPGAATLTELYAVGASTKFAGQLFICNDTNAGIGARVSIEDDNAADAAANYIIGGNANSKTIAANETVIVTGIMLGPTDTINVYSVTAGLVFNLVGVDIT